MNPLDSSNDEIEGVLRTRDENAKHFSRCISSVNLIWLPATRGTYGRKGSLSCGFKGGMVLG